MIEESLRKQIIALIHREVVPAIGCTEPIAVALCVARATEELGCVPEKIDVLLSANILKNAMGVGIPGTGMIGLPIAIALGALIGKSAYQLEVLRDCTPEAVQRGKAYVAEDRIHIGLKEGITEKLYVEIRCEAAGHHATAIIAADHTRFVYIEKDGTVSLDNRTSAGEQEETSDLPLNLRLVYDFATTAPINEISFILEARRLNENAAQKALEGTYGHELGKTLCRPLGRGIMGESIFSHILSATSCACDARMAGAMIPVMSNSGSGNQGICATMPVVVFAEENHNTEEELIRALILSHLSAIYMKQSLGNSPPSAAAWWPPQVPAWASPTSWEAATAKSSMP
jgi:L-cysteine desulfidase